jgi:hypothetical protein
MNHVDPFSFAERLIKSEPANDDLRRRYEEGKLALIERRLTPWQRRMGWLSLPIFGVMIIGVGYRLLTALHTEPRELAVLVAVGAVYVLAMFLWVLRVQFRRGRVTWQDDRAMEWVGGLSLCAMSFAMSELAGSLDDTHVAQRLEWLSIVFLGGGAFAGLFERIRRAKLEMQVKLMELELRMAELVQAGVPPLPDVPTSRA